MGKQKAGAAARQTLCSFISAEAARRGKKGDAEYAEGKIIRLREGPALPGGGEVSKQMRSKQVKEVHFSRDSLVVDLMDGRSISVPLSWYPKLLKASKKERSNWETCGGGYGVHWSELDEDLSTEGLLRGAPAPKKNS